MKWPVVEARVVIDSRSTPFIILRLIRFKQISRNGPKNFQKEPLALSSDDLIPPLPNRSSILSFIQFAACILQFKMKDPLGAMRAFANSRRFMGIPDFILPIESICSPSETHRYARTPSLWLHRASVFRRRYAL
jgi:hypothetical protein